MLIFFSNLKKLDIFLSYSKVVRKATCKALRLEQRHINVATAKKKNGALQEEKEEEKRVEWKRPRRHTFEKGQQHEEELDSQSVHFGDATQTDHTENDWNLAVPRTTERERPKLGMKQ